MVGTRMYCGRVVAVIALMLAGVTVTSGRAWAQAPAAAGDLQVGQKLSVTDDQGREFRGRLQAVGTESVTLTKGGKTLDVPYADIVKIDRLDDLKNGALIGVAVGLAWFGVDAALASSDGLTLNAAGYAVVGAMYAGLGASIGAGVDALVGGTRTIYRRGGSARFTVAPVIRRDGTAVRVQFSW